MPQRQAVARGPRHRARAVDALDQPVTALEPEDRTDLERILGRVLHHVLPPVPVVCDDVVVVAAQAVARSDKFPGSTVSSRRSTTVYSPWSRRPVATTRLFAILISATPPSRPTTTSRGL